MMLQGRILRGVGGLYWVDGPDGELLEACVRGIFRKKGYVPTAGDFVTCQPSGDPDRPWNITAIHPRRNHLVRPAVANLDMLLITVSAVNPPPDFLLVDKLLAVALVHAIEPVLILTKTDLSEAPDDILEPYRPVGCPILGMSPDDEASLDEMKKRLRQKTICLAGQSGVGKSTLINRLFGETVMSVGQVSERIGRGRHTTREVVFFPYEGGYVADTPGFSTLELAELGINGDQLARHTPEIEHVAGTCRFNDCRHTGEPGCAVPDSGIDQGRLERYRLLREQLDALNTYDRGR
ncbi:MAG: ribosome small subunit-dependent GTPase A [Ruminococcaceae bacterium]|nr:ribosome small subunit-dependent GTPase A [Oscillospiraceae bacterium]